MRHAVVLPASLLLLALASGSAVAQADAKAKQTHNKYGSPLDTMMSTRLWTDVPEAKDFVKATRPDPKTLDYTPLSGADPDRPKARDRANVEALQAELEHDRLETQQRGHGRSAAATAKRARRKSAE